MKVGLGIVCAIFNIMGLSAFIIPDELPSILSVIYSNIPTLKKGTDSRIGWGFRLGNRADFQVLMELGPQTYTQPLGNQGGSDTNKRNTLDNLANTLYAQRQQEKKEKLQKDREASKSEGGQWLNAWSKSVQKSEEKEIQPEAIIPKPGIGIGEIDAKSVIPDDSILEEMEKRKLKVKKSQESVNKTNGKKATTNRSLVSILTEEDKAISQLNTSEEKNKRPLDDVSLE